MRGAMLVQQEAGGRAGKPRAASARRPHNKAFSRTGGEEEGIQARRNLTVFLFFLYLGNGLIMRYPQVKTIINEHF